MERFYLSSIVSEDEGDEIDERVAIVSFAECVKSLWDDRPFDVKEFIIYIIDLLFLNVGLFCLLQNLISDDLCPIWILRLRLVILVDEVFYFC